MKQVLCDLVTKINGFGVSTCEEIVGLLDARRKKTGGLVDQEACRSTEFILVFLLMLLLQAVPNGKAKPRRNRKKRLRSRNSVIDDWLEQEDGADAYADLEDFLVL